MERVIGRAEGLQRRYGRQVWITEFAINTWGCRKQGCVGTSWHCHCDAPTRAQQDAYLRRVLPALEACDAIHRYAWYSARNRASDADGGSSLLEELGSLSKLPPPQLTSTGEIYRAHALAMRHAAVADAGGQ